jgi:hypothetical protein
MLRSRGPSAMRRANSLVASGLLMVLILGGMPMGRAAGLPVASKKLAVFRTCVLTATAAASTSATDSYVNQASANTNNGTATTLNAQSGLSAHQRVHIRFNLTLCSPAIPAAASIKLATLRLYATMIPAGCRTEDIFKVAASWTEAGITWNNQPFGTTINNPSSRSRTDAITMGPACQNTAAGYVNGWAVTSDVASWVSGSATNFGWMIRDDTEGSATTRTATFSAKNAANAARGPQLIVTYTT